MDLKDPDLTDGLGHKNLLFTRMKASSLEGLCLRSRTTAGWLSKWRSSERDSTSSKSECLKIVQFPRLLLEQCPRQFQSCESNTERSISRRIFEETPKDPRKEALQVPPDLRSRRSLPSALREPRETKGSLISPCSRDLKPRNSSSVLKTNLFCNKCDMKQTHPFVRSFVAILAPQIF